MNQNYLISFFLFFILMLCSACYTVTYPETCPGVSDINLISETESEIVLVY